MPSVGDSREHRGDPVKFVVDGDKRMSRVPWNFGGGPTVSGDVHEVILHDGSDSSGDFPFERGA